MKSHKHCVLEIKQNPEWEPAKNEFQSILPEGL
jgi:hypothetical protein